MLCSWMPVLANGAEAGNRTEQGAVATGQSKALRPGAIRIIDIELPDMYGHCLQSWFVVIGTKSLAPWSSVLSTG